VEHAVDYLRGKGVETIGLYAYPGLKNFYGKLGFKADEDFAVLHAQTLPSSTTEKLPKIGKHNIKAIAEFDEECFGGNRLRLLKSIILEKGNLSYCVSDGDGVVGYVAATVYESMAWVGPLICRQGNSSTAVLLVRATLAKLAGKSVYAVLPKQPSPLKDEFLRFGFKEEFFVSRMFLGKARARNCIYLAESLERG
ncbi:MAG: hypothetical protein M1167_05595, partial [Chloroflexi bacterium]|nr:hypothetical protein [Chloroflexota bacterium]